MVRQFEDLAELELRRDAYFARSLKMVDEGGPVRDPQVECNLRMKRLEEIEEEKGFEKPAVPRKCDL